MIGKRNTENVTRRTNSGSVNDRIFVLVDIKEDYKIFQTKSNNRQII